MLAKALEVSKAVSKTLGRFFDVRGEVAGVIGSLDVCLGTTFDSTTSTLLMSAAAGGGLNG